MLTPDEILRYKRQLVLKEIGGEGQQKLKASRVLVVGAGGLGSPLMLYLAAAGVGTIGIIDDDRVSLDNLQRQIAHDTKSVGKFKTKSAAEAIERLNPHVETRLYTTRLVPENALDIIRGYDIVADGSDNFATRYLVNDACYFAQACRWCSPRSARSTAISPPSAPSRQDEAGNPRPSYRCLFPEPPPEGTVAPCSEAGILGAVAGVIGCLAAVEVVKELLRPRREPGRQAAALRCARRRASVPSPMTGTRTNPLNGREPRFADLSHHRKADGGG